MLRSLFFSFLFLVLSITVKPQGSKTVKNNTIDVGMGMVYTTFQDSRFSNVRYNGLGGTILLDYVHSGKFVWGVNTSFFYGLSRGKTHHKKASDMSGNLTGDFLFPISKTGKSKLFLGPRADFINMFIRKDNNLTNNSSSITSGTALFAEILYQRNINDRWNFTARGALQLISSMYIGTSFGFAAPQKQLEDGTYDYNGLQSPHYATPLWEYLNIETDFRFLYKKRWLFGYRWNMQQDYSVKGMPVTRGVHSFYAAFRFLNKSK